MRLALIAYACLTLGALIGFLTCALLTAGKQADHHTELAQAYERGKKAALQEREKAA